ncbi:MAG: choice-of-anchor Q domain-containing protein, partial [Candidatus Acidiferrum sp.]
TVGPCGATENCPWIYGSNNLAFGAGSTVANAANITGTIIQDPRLTNVGGYDFRPTPNSPVIGKGIHVAGLTHDIAGTPRGATPSIGAYE